MWGGDLSLVFRGCGDPHKQIPLPTGPYSLEPLPCRAASNKLRQVFSTSCLKVHVPDGRAGASWGIWGSEQRVLQPWLGMHMGFPPRGREEEWEGKEKALVHSPAWPGVRLRCAPTCPLCSPLSPAAQMCGNLDLWNRTYGNCTGQSHAVNKNTTWVFSGVKVKQAPWKELPPPLFILRVPYIQTLCTIQQFHNKLRC